MCHTMQIFTYIRYSWAKWRNTVKFNIYFVCKYKRRIYFFFIIRVIPKGQVYWDIHKLSSVFGHVFFVFFFTTKFKLLERNLENEKEKKCSIASISYFILSFAVNVRSVAVKSMCLAKWEDVQFWLGVFLLVFSQWFAMYLVKYDIFWCGFWFSFFCGFFFIWSHFACYIVQLLFFSLHHVGDT